MSIRLSWDTADYTVIHQTFEGKWTWEEFYETAQETVAMIQSVSHTVHVFSDFTASAGLPLGGAISHARSVMRRFPDNWGLLVIVNESIFINVLVSTFRSMFATDVGRKTFAVKSVEAAYALVWEHAEIEV